MALTKKLTDIADAIRNKTGKSDLLTLEQMPTEISAIETGGGEIPEIVLSGDCKYALRQPAFQAIYDYIRTENITDARYMFDTNNAESYPFELNFNPDYDSKNISFLFYNNTKLKRVPKINGLTNVASSERMFSGCYKIKEIEEDSTSSITYKPRYNYISAAYMFYYCYALRKIPSFYKKAAREITSTSYTSQPSYMAFYECRCLDEAVGLYPQTPNCSTNVYKEIVKHCHRLKDFTFELDENGQPYVRGWSNQIIDFSVYTGWAMEGRMANINDDITDDVKIIDDASYAALKNHQNAWTEDVAYSRYNHDSAVNTINSLPDCSSGSGNTIKFKGEAGSKTDGGAINTLTEEEIAIATAKGWTVTLV